MQLENLVPHFQSNLCTGASLRCQRPKLWHVDSLWFSKNAFANHVTKLSNDVSANYVSTMFWKFTPKHMQLCIIRWDQLHYCVNQISNFSPQYIQIITSWTPTSAFYNDVQYTQESPKIEMFSDGGRWKTVMMMANKMQVQHAIDELKLY